MRALAGIAVVILAVATIVIASADFGYYEDPFE